MYGVQPTHRVTVHYSCTRTCTSLSLHTLCTKYGAWQFARSPSMRTHPPSRQRLHSLVALCGVGEGVFRIYWILIFGASWKSNLSDSHGSDFRREEEKAFLGRAHTEVASIELRQPARSTVQCAISALYCTEYTIRYASTYQLPSLGLSPHPLTSYQGRYLLGHHQQSAVSSHLPNITTPGLRLSILIVALSCLGYME